MVTVGKLLVLHWHFLCEESTCDHRINVTEAVMWDFSIRIAVTRKHHWTNNRVTCDWDVSKAHVISLKSGIVEYWNKKFNRRLWCMYQLGSKHICALWYTIIHYDVYTKCIYRSLVMNEYWIIHSSGQVISFVWIQNSFVWIQNRLVFYW